MIVTAHVLRALARMRAVQACTECDCPAKTCKPEQNEGRVCWRSGCGIPVGYFSEQQPPKPSEGQS